MAQRTIRQAINEAFDQEMERDSTVILMGEDIIGGTGSPGEEEAWGGAMGIYKGLYRKYGDRLLDTPLSEAAFVGAAIGAATCGMRPVAELMFIDFLGVCFDQIFNQAAKFRYMFGGKAETPVVIRTMYGAGLSAAAQHSQTLTSIFTHIPGIKVVCPSSPYDAKGLMVEGDPRQRPGDISASTRRFTTSPATCRRSCIPSRSARRTFAATAMTSPSPPTA